MRLYGFVLILCFLILGQTFGQGNKNQAFISNEIYVKVKKEYYRKTKNSGTKLVTMSQELPFLSKAVFKSVVKGVSRPFYLGKSDNVHRIYKIDISSDKLDAIIELIKLEPSIEYAEKIPIRQLFVQPNDPFSHQQWYLSKIKAEQAWSFQSDLKSDVVVAVIDNAFQVNHPDLQGSFVAGYDVSDNDTDPSPPNTSFNHGTHVAGIISAMSNNAIGIAGVGMNRVKVMPVKVTPDNANPDKIYDGYEGIQWAVANGAKIINLSWGGYDYYQFEQDIIREAHEQGVLIIAAAGNAGDEAYMYPASYEHVISVASTDENDNRSSFSSFGDKVDIAAPGSRILSTIPFDSYATFSGTSMAAPIVAAAAAFLKHVHTAASIHEIEDLLKKTADPLGTLQPELIGKMGAGRLNIFKAVSCYNASILTATIQTIDPLYICSTDVVRLDASVSVAESYKWYKNDVFIGHSKNISVNEEGNYSLVLQEGICEVKTKPVRIFHNTQKTSKPTIATSNAVGFYCTEANPLRVSLSAPPFYGPKSSVYTGVVVGYDNNKQSAENPTVTIDGIGGTLAQLTVQVTWQKKDGRTEISCDMPDGGGIPFFNEVGFKLKSPSGSIITLLPTGKYERGSAGDSRLFTMEFAMNGSEIVQGSKPANGIFLPHDSFERLYGETPVGVWTLLPTDNSFLDPLCVSGFSVTVRTMHNTSNTAPQFTWYATEMSMSTLATGDKFVPLITQKSGSQSFWVSARNPGYCESDRVVTEVRVRDVPLIFATSLAALAGDKTSLLYPADSVRYAASPSPSVLIYKSNQVYSYPLNDISVQQEIVTICKPEVYIVAAGGCTGKVRWSNGFVGEAQLVSIRDEINWEVICEREWGICEVPPPKTFKASVGQSNDISLTSTIEAGVSQTYLGNKVSIGAALGTPTDIKVLAQKSITFEPGFQVNSTSVFEARIGGCPN